MSKSLRNDDLSVDQFVERYFILFISLILVFTAIILVFGAFSNSPTEIEPAQLTSGIYHLTTGKFDLGSVNPPLVRCLAAVPLYFSGIKFSCNSEENGLILRPERAAKVVFVNNVGGAIFYLISISRIACIPFVVIGGMVCASWARWLYGPLSGLVACSLWCSSPFVLGNGMLLTTDVPAATMSAVSVFLIVQHLNKPASCSLVVISIVVASSLLTKFTCILLVPIAVVTISLFTIVNILGALNNQSLMSPLFAETIQIKKGFVSASTVHRSFLCRAIADVILVLTLSVFIVNAFYCFDGSCRSIESYNFHSQIFTSLKRSLSTFGDAYYCSWLSELPLPVPRYYILGLDLQMKDIEEGTKSYINGQWLESGVWWFYLYAFFLKTPIGTLLLIPLSCLMSVPRSACYIRLANEFVLLLAMCVFGVAVSQQSDFTSHSRYMLPVLPFFFIWISRVFASPIQSKRCRVSVGALCLLASTLSSSLVFPDSISYFNEIVSGPKNGHHYLIGSNLSWGQNLFLVKRWIQNHPEIDRMHLAISSPIEPAIGGIKYLPVTTGPSVPLLMSARRIMDYGPRPGWYIIDVNFLAGEYESVVYDGRGHGTFNRDKEFNYAYFKYFNPVDRIGNTAYVYMISLEDANKVRILLGLPELD